MTPSELAPRSPPPPRSVARSASIVGLAVLSSRFMGLARELLFAAYFGAGVVFDAFVTAFRIPNLFRDLFAEGALSAAFVKTFAQKLDKDGEVPAWRLASLVFCALTLIVGVVTCAGVLAAPWIVGAIAPGFSPEKAALATSLTRVMFPFLLMVALAAVAMGILNARGVFGIPAMASTFFNIGSIVVGLGAAFALAPELMIATTKAVLGGDAPPIDADAARRAILGMALGVLVGGLLQFACQIPALRRAGFHFSAILDWKDPGLRAVFALMVPAILGTAATQVNVFVNNNFASRLGDGPVSWLNYAFRLMQFPIGVFGVAIATATLPSIARAAGRERTDEFSRTLTSSLSLALFLTIPSAVGLAVLGEPIIALVYERGRFDHADTVATAQALAFYALGLVGYSLIKILAPAFYAVDDARTPARVSLASIAVNFGLCALFVGPFGHRGLALSTSIVATANAALLFGLLVRRVDTLRAAPLWRTTGKVLWASAAMAAVCVFVSGGLERWLGLESLPRRLGVVFGAIGCGAATYAVACTLLRVDELSMLRTRILRRRQA